ncbi:glycosyltransferase [Thalassospiraceae bacterium LMO-JJ14]|nr:glycosyltransferase [Thalassospiraceae bacterium LMO-JJ14]
MTEDPKRNSDENKDAFVETKSPGFPWQELLGLFVLFLFPLISVLNFKAQVVVILAPITFWLLFSSGKRTSWHADGKAVVVTLWVLIIWAGVTLGWSPSVSEGTERLFKLLVICVLVTLLWQREWGRDLISLIAGKKALLALCLGVVCGGIIFFYNLQQAGWKTISGQGPFVATLALLVAPSLYLAVNAGFRWWKIVIIVSFFAVPVLVSSNLAAQIAFVTAIFVFTLALSAPRAVYVAVAVVGVAILSAPATMCIFGISPLDIDAGGFTSLFGDLSVSASHRLAIYDFSIKAVCEKPLLGWGLEASAHIPGGQEYVPGLGKRKFIPSHPHSLPLHIAVEVGIIGLAIVIALFGSILGTVSRHFGNHRRVAALLAVISAFLIISDLSYSAWASWLLCTVIFCALITGIGEGEADQAGEKKRLLILAAEDWYFISHRLPMARGAQNMGFEVTVACRSVDQGKNILREGFALQPLRYFRRGSTNLAIEIVCFLELLVVYFRVKPNVVLHVGMKAALVGSCVAFFFPGLRIINLFPGLGAVFTRNRKRYFLLRLLIINILRIVHRLKKSSVIVQNMDNQRYILEHGVTDAESVYLLRGSGVDTDLFKPREHTAEKRRPTVTLAGRMLWSKGVGNFVEAARILRNRKVDVRMALVGIPDYANNEYVPSEQLMQWNEMGIVDWQGYRDDMHNVWQESDIAAFPTYYGEGIPLALIEAGACGLPVVATDTVGCRDIIEDGVNGILIPRNDPVRLADAIQTLINDPKLAQQFGKRIRAEIVKDYAAGNISKETQNILERLYLGHGLSG